MSATLKLRRVRLVTVDQFPGESGAPSISGPADAHLIAKAVLPTDREGFAVLHLDARHQMRSVELVSVGSLNASIVHPREVFKAAILANADKIILAHNHPSGSPEPSNEDISITRRLVEAGEIIGIEVLDHVVISGARFVSLNQRQAM